MEDVFAIIYIKCTCCFDVAKIKSQAYIFSLLFSFLEVGSDATKGTNLCKFVGLFHAFERTPRYISYNSHVNLGVSSMSTIKSNWNSLKKRLIIYCILSVHARCFVSRRTFLFVRTSKMFHNSFDKMRNNAQFNLLHALSHVTIECIFVHINPYVDILYVLLIDPRICNEHIGY